MKKKVIFLTIAVMLLNLSSCKKSENNENNISETNIIEATETSSEYYSGSFIPMSLTQNVYEYDGYLYYLTYGKLQRCKFDLSDNELIGNKVNNFWIIDSTLFYCMEHISGNMTLYTCNLESEEFEKKVLIRLPANKNYNDVVLYGNYIFASNDKMISILDMDGNHIRTLNNCSAHRTLFKDNYIYTFSKDTQSYLRRPLSDPYNMPSEEVLSTNTQISIYSSDNYIFYNESRNVYNFTNVDDLSSYTVKFDYFSDGMPCMANYIFSNDEYAYFDILNYTMAIGNYTGDSYLCRVKFGETTPEFVTKKVRYTSETTDASALVYASYCIDNEYNK